VIIYHKSASDGDALTMMCGKDEEPRPSRTSHCRVMDVHCW
jgi:hypothetical protein